MTAPEGYAAARDRLQSLVAAGLGESPAVDDLYDEMAAWKMLMTDAERRAVEPGECK